MNNDERVTLWVGAFRYYCGRQTYAVQSFVKMLIKAWPELPKQAKDVIQRDLEREFASDDEARANKDNYKPLGWDCDRQSWEQVRRLWQ